MSTTLTQPTGRYATVGPVGEIDGALPGVIIDLSSGNGDPSKWNWGAMRNAGVRAVIAKATEDTNYANPYYVAARNMAKAMGLDFAAYHFATFTDAVLEAQWFVQHAGADAKILDSETNTNVGWQNMFLAHLNLASPLEEMDYGSASTLPRTGIRSLLWPASYGSGAPGFGDMWQDTDRLTIPGCPVQVDGSVWTGSLNDYLMFFRGQSPGPLPTQGDDNVLAFNPGSGGSSWALAPDGGVDGDGPGAPWLGGLEGNRFNWQQVGKLAGIAPWWDGTGWGYKIAVQLPSATGQGGGWFDYYRFPSNGTLKGADAPRFEETDEGKAYLAAAAPSE